MTWRDPPSPLVRILRNDRTDRPGAVQGRRLVVDLDGSAGSVRTARLAAASFLTDAEAVPALAAAFASPRGAYRTALEDVLLVIAELVANACRHAPGPCRLTVYPTAETIEVAVHDRGGDRLRLGSDGLRACYGLIIVARLTRGIRVTAERDGKVVQAAVPLGVSSPGTVPRPGLR
ncbi:ATP-binding protein [Yinghuangia soli]|uniref:ATP-binding protein n=1 Tax=Yinghuangia soli TaxID=2908204 RepID=A0AA41U2N2_9ACTN|nr:ATP-binding protein [Yinghuangia soli]MCF2527279.1 ATP-binding protein [Yinghuangia soli]